MDKTIEQVLGLPGAERRQGFAALLKRYGADGVSAWTDGSRHKNHLVHRLAIVGDADALEQAAHAKIDINVSRAHDGCTALHLAFWHGQPTATETLKRLGADATKPNKYGETAQDAEQQRDERYVCWHQQADLLMNVCPLVLRRLFIERWNAIAGPGADIGVGIIRGLEPKEVLSKTATMRRGSTRMLVEEDLRGRVWRGLRFWINGVEMEAAEHASWTSPSGRLLGGSEVALTSSWPHADLRKAHLEVQKVPPEPRLPPGDDAYKKVRSGRVDNWDLTILAHFLGDEHVHLASRLVPEAAHRRLVREIKDARNRAGLHLGRAEVELVVLNTTAELVERVCSELLPAMADEVHGMVAHVRSRKVVAEETLHEMERQIIAEHDRAELMEGCLRTASKFKDHLPPGAFCGVPAALAGKETANAQNSSSGRHLDSSETGSTTASENVEAAPSEWSATQRTSMTRAEPCHCRVYASSDELLQALGSLPGRCDKPVVASCISMALACPPSKELLIVVCGEAGMIDDAMLRQVGDREVHDRWKGMRTTIDKVAASLDTFKDWCCCGGVLVSGEQGRILRVTAEFRPPRSAWRAKSPALQRAMDVADAAKGVAVVAERGTITVIGPDQATLGQLLQMHRPVIQDEQDDLGDQLPPVSEWGEDDLASATQDAETAIEADGCTPNQSTAHKVGGMFWPHKRQHEQVTQALLPQAEEQVHRWADGSAKIGAANAQIVSENTSKWLWSYFNGDRQNQEKALCVSQNVLDRILDGGFDVEAPRLLHPMGELLRLLGRTEESVLVLNRARKIATRHTDFEIGFSVHHSLFHLYARQEKLVQARAMLAGAQALLNREAAAQRDGPGMDEFLRAKQLFQASSMARLDGKEALKSNDPIALRKVQKLLEETIDGMKSSHGEGGMFCGNTDLNVAELLTLLCHVCWASRDVQGARKALEMELPLRRRKGQEGELAAALVNLGRACLELNDVPAADQHLSESEDLLQSMAGEGADTRGFVFAGIAAMREALWLLAQCAERKGDIEAALAKLRRLAAIMPIGQDGGVGTEILRLKGALRCQESAENKKMVSSEAPSHDNRKQQNESQDADKNVEETCGGAVDETKDGCKNAKKKKGKSKKKR